MGGLGSGEFAIIVVTALLVFGIPGVVGFWLGYRAGKKNEPATPQQPPAVTARESEPTPEPEAENTDTGGTSDD